MIQWNKSSAVESFQLASSFEAVRDMLLQSRFTDRMEKPLAFWALPNDRRLPLAFLGRTLRDLLNTPFEQLSATPGIGQKKIASLVKLLHRATRDEPPAVPFSVDDSPRDKLRRKAEPVGDRFDPALVSEVLWAQWCETVRRHQVSDLKLGRLTPSLQLMPTVIWHNSLGDYLDYTVGQIRSLKTYGEKRVRVILEVFHVAHQALAQASPHLSIQLQPRFIQPIHDWVSSKLASSESLPVADLQTNVVVPILNQLLTDGGEVIHRLAEGRLGIKGEAQSVRSQARRMNVTRARVYQLLDECGKIMAVRWPEGKRTFEQLIEKAQATAPITGAGREALTLLQAASALFYPDKNVPLEDSVGA